MSKDDDVDATNTNNFWMTLNLLVGIDWKKPQNPEEVEDWLDTVEAKRNLWRQKKSFCSGSKETNNQSTASNGKAKKTDEEDGQQLIFELPKVDCSFNHPKVRSRLERLMGSNLVRLTDRNYMLKLHDRILEDYIQSKNNRIAEREMQEREREKNLVLSGKVPFSNAPKDMENHPVLLIHEHCEKLIAERRALIKVPKVCIPLYLYVDTTPDPPSGLSISDGHIFRPDNESLCVPPVVHLQFSEEDDIARGYMFTPDDYETKKIYEDPLIDEFSLVESVEEMYDLADELVGPLKTITVQTATQTATGPTENKE